MQQAIVQYTSTRARRHKVPATHKPLLHLKLHSHQKQGPEAHHHHSHTQPGFCHNSGQCLFGSQKPPEQQHLQRAMRHTSCISSSPTQSQSQTVADVKLQQQTNSHTHHPSLHQPTVAPFSANPSPGTWHTWTQPLHSISCLQESHCFTAAPAVLPSPAGEAQQQLHRPARQHAPAASAAALPQLPPS